MLIAKAQIQMTIDARQIALVKHGKGIWIMVRGSAMSAPWGNARLKRSSAWLRTCVNLGLPHIYPNEKNK